MRTLNASQKGFNHVSAFRFYMTSPAYAARAGMHWIKLKSRLSASTSVKQSGMTIDVAPAIGTHGVGMTMCASAMPGLDRADIVVFRQDVMPLAEDR